jgi:hypothetical protein
VRQHHEQTVYTAAHVLGYLSPLIGGLAARVVLGVKAALTKRGKP